jgi:hypothetical protein
MIAAWQENYQMCGSTQSFKDGGTVNSTTPHTLMVTDSPDAKIVTITGLSGLEPIKFGQTYNLKSWSDYSVADDPLAPPNGFRFKNAVTASLVLTLEVGGSYTLGMLNLTMHLPTHQNRN